VSRKQRHTARRVWQRLVAEYGATLAEVTVSRYVARCRVELGLDQVEVAVPQTHPPGTEAEVDFGEFHATIAGVWLKLWVFVMRLSHSGRAFHVAFATQAQEAFLEGHVLCALQRMGIRLSDPRLVAAIVDRITFNAHILETGTQSYRLRTSTRRKRAS
jgi:transposase